MSRTPSPAKQVDLLERSLRELGASPKRSALQEAVARMNGYASWNQFVATSRTAGARSEAQEQVEKLVREFNPFTGDAVDLHVAARLWRELVQPSAQADETGLHHAAGDLERLARTAAALRDTLNLRINRGRYAQPAPDSREVYMPGTFWPDNSGEDAFWSLCQDHGGQQEHYYEVPASQRVAVIHQAVVVRAELTYYQGTKTAPMKDVEQLREWLWAQGFVLAPQVSLGIATHRFEAATQVDVHARVPQALLDWLEHEVPGVQVN